MNIQELEKQYADLVYRNKQDSKEAEELLNKIQEYYDNLLNEEEDE